MPDNYLWAFTHRVVSTELMSGGANEYDLFHHGDKPVFHGYNFPSQSYILFAIYMSRKVFYLQ